MGSFKGVKEVRQQRGGRRGGGCLRKSSIKQSHMGEGPQTECWRDASLIFSTRHPCLSFECSHKYLKCGCCNNAEAPEVESRANRDWMGSMFV